MKKKILFALVTLTSFVRGMESDNEKLSLTNRPLAAQKIIDENFQELSAQDEGAWWWNGDDGEISKYEMMGIDDYVLALDILEKGIAKGQKEFVFLDIGGGQGGWAQRLMKFLNSQEDLPQDLHIHLISVTGEGLKDKIKTEGICTFHLKGKFKIEDFPTALKGANLAKFSGKIDLAVSRLTWIHLVDPLKTLEDVLNALRPQGRFFVDGIPLYFEGQKLSKVYERKNDLDFYEPSKHLISNVIGQLPAAIKTKNNWQRDDADKIGLYPIFIQKTENPVKFSAGYTQTLTQTSNTNWVQTMVLYRNKNFIIDQNKKPEDFVGDQGSIDLIKGLQSKRIEDFSFSKALLKKSNEVGKDSGLVEGNVHEGKQRQDEIEGYFHLIYDKLKNFGTLSPYEFSHHVALSLQSTLDTALEMLQKHLENNRKAHEPLKNLSETLKKLSNDTYKAFEDFEQGLKNKKVNIRK